MRAVPRALEKWFSTEEWRTALAPERVINSNGWPKRERPATTMSPIQRQRCAPASPPSAQPHPRTPPRQGRPPAPTRAGPGMLPTKFPRPGSQACPPLHLNRDAFISADPSGVSACRALLSLSSVQPACLMPSHWSSSMDPILSLSSAQPGCLTHTATGLLRKTQFSPLAPLSQPASCPQPLVFFHGPNSLP